jgi:hypothetical protein
MEPRPVSLPPPVFVPASGTRHSFPDRVAAAVFLALMLGALMAPTHLRAADGKTDLMLARDCAKGDGCTQTWTLTSRLGHILESYEKRLGPVNRAYRLLGIEFTSGPRPRIWYPNFGSGPKSIIIQLTHRARTAPELALFQLAHEAFHLLNPVKPGASASVLEEGLASYFATRYLEANAIAERARPPAEAAYKSAYDTVAGLAARYPDFDQRLRRFRELNGGFSNASPDEIRAAFPSIKARDAGRLAAAFEKATN